MSITSSGISNECRIYSLLWVLLPLILFILPTIGQKQSIVAQLVKINSERYKIKLKYYLLHYSILFNIVRLAFATLLHNPGYNGRYK